MIGSQGEINGDGWKRVLYAHFVRKDKKRWDYFPWGGRSQNRSKQNMNQKVSSFYVSEFPYSSSTNDLFDLFGYAGKVIKVSILSRRNNIGKQFRFARFLEVEDDGWMLVVRLDNILIRGKKIHVNLPRHQKGKTIKEGGLGDRGKNVTKVMGGYRGREDVIRLQRSDGCDKGYSTLCRDSGDWRKKFRGREGQRSYVEFQLES